MAEVSWSWAWFWTPVGLCLPSLRFLVLLNKTVFGRAGSGLGKKIKTAQVEAPMIIDGASNSVWATYAQFVWRWWRDSPSYWPTSYVSAFFPFEVGLGEKYYFHLFTGGGRSRQVRTASNYDLFGVRFRYVRETIVKELHTEYGADI